ncbi:uncharacterized protein LOC116351162 isoform X3 [Contarinia nasturtii]|uniref:uncharacterized protein LOC116351162 isoform X3 n=1 Tax=Contarinia nasturtii TaxID=265458 RepID=UPI0012D41C81|nr:uncharacterized protein LOC116351162 isoform X3 [Contarinia nasturtii]XP_031639098.1 uncharacterized protein LOC116351162 isoform X3 [Contarinia nasturtii]XP_031639099.1 uncharacterized protein LOC116351162 isoform X3 [Contarinia nasturtii]
MATEDGSKTRTLAIAIGWLTLIISVALFFIVTQAIFPWLEIYGQIMLIIICSPFWLFNFIWIFGALFNKPMLMLIALAGWIFPAAICLSCASKLIFENPKKDKLLFACFPMSFFGIYIIAVFCYCSMKSAAIRRKSNTMRLNIKYEVPQGNVEQNENIDQI